MKYLIVLTIAFVAVVTAQDQSAAQGHHPDKTDCVEQSGVSSKQLVKYRAGERTDDKEVHDYSLCVVKQTGMFTEEDGFNVEAVVAKFMASHLEEEKARELAAKCFDRNEQKSSAADWAYRGIQCLADNKIEDIMKEASRRFHENDD